MLVLRRKDVLTEKEDGVYVEENNIEYLKNHWAATEYSFFLEQSTLVDAKEGDLGYGVEDPYAVPKTTNTYDEVYVNKKLVRTDYNIGLHQAKPLIDEIEKVFGKDQDWKGNRFNIIDIPDIRKVHTTPIVRIGGLSIFITFISYFLLIYFEIAKSKYWRQKV